MGTLTIYTVLLGQSVFERLLLFAFFFFFVYFVCFVFVFMFSMAVALFALTFAGVAF